VEGESFPEQFKKLEHKIETLVRTCGDLKQSKSELEAKVGDLEQALKAKVASEERYAEEKTIIRGKVGDLLGKLDQVLASE
jgi:hypothetical protein